MTFLGRGPRGEVFECDNCGQSEGPGPPDVRAAPGSTGATTNVSPASSTSQTVVAFPDIEAIASDVGGCRRCGGNSGTLNVGEETWGFCHIHDQRWLLADVDPSWRFEDPQMWAENELFLAAFRIVDPLRRAVGS